MIVVGDAFELLPKLERRFGVAITSPPYSFTTEQVERVVEMMRAVADATWLVWRQPLLTGRIFVWESSHSRNYVHRWDVPGPVTTLRATAPRVDGYDYEAFPDALLNRIFAWSPDGDVLDPFCGSGTVARHARRRGREFYGIERDVMVAWSARASCWT